MKSQGSVEARERCPECAKQGKDTKGDNLAIYADGHKYCYACHYHTNSDATRLMEMAVQKQLEVPEPGKPTALPSDCTRTIPAEILTWLDKYGIIREEIIKYDIRYSPTRHALIFPIRNESGGLLAYQRRNFSPNDRSKWITYGDLKDHLHLLGTPEHSDKPIVIVEDIISAIKVARHARSLCIFGSSVRAEHILRVRYLTKTLIFWLDADKYKESILFAKRAEQVGLETRVVYTEQDPKGVSDDEIKTIIKL